MKEEPKETTYSPDDKGGEQSGIGETGQYATNADDLSFEIDESVSSPKPGAQFTDQDIGPGTKIGPYELLETLGQGGMGTVYRARQEEPVRREVALKIVRRGVGNEEVLARFTAERQTLALMTHDNIARVLDGGATSCGQPYLVMELVNGVPVTEYCYHNGLGTRKRLEIFITVCRAIQHAHRKGIIHRDIKPSNILVAQGDDGPVVKVIDFGIAKAIDGFNSDRQETEVGQVLGTVEYMSPEQADLNPHDIDTRSDVYSLGVLLYQLLTGTTPIGAKKLTDASFTEVLREVREGDPVKPSKCIERTDSTTAISSPDFHTDSTRLLKSVRGDVDWIVMKALEKDRERRYESANELGLDIERYLRGEAILARPPSAIYLFRKFARRHKAALAFACLATLLLIVCTVISTTMAIRAERARRTAEAKKREALQKEQEARQATLAESTARKAEAKQRQLAQESAAAERRARAEEAEQRELAEEQKRAAEEQQQLAEMQRLRAEEERRTAEEVTKYLIDIFRSPSPRSDGHEVRVIDVLVTAEKNVKKRFNDAPRVKASLLRAIGNAYVGLGVYSPAIPLLRKATDIRAQEFGPTADPTTSAMVDLALAIDANGNPYDAVTLLEEAVKAKTELHGENSNDVLVARVVLGNTYEKAGEYNKALEMKRETLARMQEHLGADHPDTLIAMDSLAATYLVRNMISEAAVLLKEVIKLSIKKNGLDHPDTLRALEHLALGLARAKKYQEAERILAEVSKRMEKVYGPSHPSRLLAFLNLASIYMHQRKFQRALGVLESIVKRQEAIHPKGHPNITATRTNIAICYSELDRVEEAETILNEIVRITERKDKHSSGLVVPLRVLAKISMRRKEFDRATSLVQRVLDIQIKHFGKQGAQYLSAFKLLGICQLHSDSETGKATLEKFLATIEAVSKRKIPAELDSLGQDLLDNGFPEEATLYLSRCVELRNAGRNSWRLANTRSLLGGAYTRSGNYEEAKSHLEEGLQGLLDAQDKIPADHRRLIPLAEKRLEEYQALTKREI